MLQDLKGYESSQSLQSFRSIENSFDSGSRVSISRMAMAMACMGASGRILQV